MHPPEIPAEVYTHAYRATPMATALMGTSLAPLCFTICSTKVTNKKVIMNSTRKVWPMSLPPSLHPLAGHN